MKMFLNHFCNVEESCPFIRLCMSIKKKCMGLRGGTSLRTFLRYFSTPIKQLGKNAA